MKVVTSLLDSSGFSVIGASIGIALEKANKWSITFQTAHYLPIS